MLNITALVHKAQPPEDQRENLLINQKECTMSTPGNSSASETLSL